MHRSELLPEAEATPVMAINTKAKLIFRTTVEVLTLRESGEKIISRPSPIGNTPK